MGSQRPLPGRAAVKTRTNAGDMDALRALLSQYLADEPAAYTPALVPEASAAFAHETGHGQPKASRTAMPALEKPEPVASKTTSNRTRRALLVTEEPPPPADLSGTLRLVENAAARIHDYEQRFRDIEIDARAFVARIDEEQERLMSYVATLESEVDAAEERGRRAETALDEVRLQAWEERLMRRHAEMRAADAEAEAEKCQTYLRRVYEILERMNLLDGLTIKLPD